MDNGLSNYQGASIRRDLILSLVLTIVVVFVVIGSLFFYFTAQRAEQDLEQQMVDTSSRLADVLGAAIWNIDDLLIENIVEAYLEAEHVVGIRVVDMDGRMLYEAGRREQEAAIQQTEVIYFNEQEVGQLVLTVTRAGIVAQQRVILLQTALILAFVLGAVVVVTRIVLNRFLTEPLAQLARRIDRIATGDYEYRLASMRQVEVDFIGQRVNLMAEQIAKRERQLRELIDTLEERVLARTKRLEAAASLSDQLNSILDFEQLLDTLVTETQERFHYYHVQIYLLEEAADGDDMLVIHAGTGRAGAEMKARGHSIPLATETSLVAQAARRRDVVIVKDVHQNPHWLPNVLLPATKGEMAVPIIAENKMVGILDIQTDDDSGLDKSDIDLLRSLANHIAVALTNARLFAEIEQAHQASEMARRQAELAKAAADQANQAKSEFLSNMSHELRTPLNGILGYTQILQRNKDLTPLQRDSLNIIHQSGKHLLTLITDVLDLSKIEAGKLELYPHPFDFQSFLNGLAGIIRIRAQERGIGFDIEEGDGLPQGVLADEKRLRQILINLLNNGIKFTDKGNVLLRIRALSSMSDSVLLRFEVIDTGVGMKPAQLRKIFRPFEQVGDVQRRGEGTGLGLAITRRLVHLMRSELKVQSEPNKGTTFWFDLHLPLVLEKIEAGGDTAEVVREITHYDGVKQKILIVDDKVHNRGLLISILEPLGFEIYEAINGDEALEAVVQYQPDLVFMDMMMPVMTGYEATSLLRTEYQMKSLPVIAISASVFDDDKQRIFEAGCDAFLAKPIQIQELLDVMVEYLPITWVYATDEGKKEKGDKVMEMVVPEQAQLEELHELAVYGNMRNIRRWAEALAASNSQYELFADKLQALAKSYQSQKILDLVEQHLV
ncbi:MAG TPA: ATP-binding protein [Anaerolineae bacterium]|nr:ATP-binding protein [Anaerolineae bacterium]